MTDRRSAHKKPTRFAKKSATRHTYSYMNTVTHREPQHSKIKLKCTKKHRWFSTVDRKEHITSNNNHNNKNTLKYTYIDCNYNHQKCMMLNFVYDVFLVVVVVARMDLAFQSDRQIFQFDLLLVIHWIIICFVYIFWII